MPTKLEVPEGTEFGRLTVDREISEYVSPGGHRLRQFTLHCECGNIVDALLSNLRKPGHTTSCGCLHREVMSEVGKSNITHGLSYEPLYATYNQMVDRCTNPDHPAYENYGARGITVCEEWTNDINTYIDWVKSNGYQPGLSVDRRDNDGNYEPENCRVTDMTVQSRNRRYTKLTEEKSDAIRADNRSQRAIARDYGISQTHVSDVKSFKAWK